MVTDLFLHLYRYAVQALGRAVAVMVVQERARWLNLSGLSRKEKAHLLDVPGDLKGLFGTGCGDLAEEVWGKEKGGRSTSTLSTQKDAPSIPADVRKGCKPAGLPHHWTSAPSSGGCPEQTTGAERRMD